ncbi:DUF4397 domain-containing protein [Fulvivirga sediminis]|uniref:DUF4397 domain-containing protein n=1 Tax=Fulvivirga sediminis TaxID=2803949 RepID=A0A937FC65_9BACT|nr:DUF4397 domain-containing protein [Fulvivirga sediminis]MBL3658499.1 DUF4397 domain-containing protein [Fulvivirga sediminis]
MNTIRPFKTLFYLTIFLFGTFSLTSCLDSDDPTAEYTPISLIAIYQGVPDLEVEIELDSQTITTKALEFEDYTKYHSYPVGQRNFKFESKSGDSLASVSFRFEENYYYSIFLSGTDTTVRPILTKDTPISGGLEDEAAVRFINLSPDSDLLALRVKDSETNLFTYSPFRAVSSFSKLNSAPTVFEIVNPDGDVLASSTSYRLNMRSYHTVIAQGYVEPKDGLPRLKIKILSNSN